MRLFQSHSSQQVDRALVVLRLIAGATFIAHGAQKLFVYGFDGVGGAFTQMGIPFGTIVGPMVGLLEFLGGIALVLGLLTRLAALGLAINMVGAMWLVHLPNGFFLPNGVEFALSLFGIATALVMMGAGAYSVDAKLAARTPVASSTASPKVAGSRRAA